MGIFSSLKPNGEFERHQKMFEEQRKQMIETMKGMNFNQYEQEQITAIIDEAQKKIREIGEKLVGTNINTNPKRVTDKAMKDVDKIIKAVPKQIEEKLKEIIAVKKDQGTL